MALVQGIGINDADYDVTQRSNGKITWVCPIYQSWASMLGRCYSESIQAKKPGYIGCTVSAQWHKFSVFRRWALTQPWRGNQLDKDLLQPGNKVYGPDTCVFISGNLNKFMTERGAARGIWPAGVWWNAKNKRFQVGCCNPVTGKRESLGYFDCPDQAHQAWKTRKLEHALTLASQQTDDRIAMALVARYC